MVTPARDREALDQAIVRGSELLKQGKLDQAQRAFRAALEIDSDNTKVLALLGLTYFRGGQFAEARPIYEELVSRAPTDASHRLNLGLVYLKLGDGDKAITALEASRALDPSQGRAISYLGLAYARAGRYAEAYRSFLLAGQNELASEVEVNLTAAERDGIQAQLRPPAPDTADAKPAVDAKALAADTKPGIAPESTMRAAGSPTVSRTASGELETRRTAHTVQRSGTDPTVARTKSEPRTKPPSAPPGKKSAEDELSAKAAAAIRHAPATTRGLGMGELSNPEITIVKPEPPPEARIEAPKMTESQQFVLPNRPDPSAPQAPHDGHSMVSLAVAAAAPTTPAITRTAAGGIPPRPLSELATEDLVRPDDGTDRFEIGANGTLIIRVTERVLTRLDGVHVSGGDLAYEPATRRSRGHQTEERFDFGSSPLHAVTGTGYLIAVPGKHATFSAVVLDDDILYLREDLVFAFEATLRWENGNVPGLRGKLPVVQFRGDGALAIRVDRPLVRVKLTPQGVVFVDADRLAGWIGRVIPRAVVPPSGGPMGAMCVECTGEGIVLVEPAPEQAAARSIAETPKPEPPAPLEVPPPPQRDTPPKGVLRVETPPTTDPEAAIDGLDEF